MDTQTTLNIWPDILQREGLPLNAAIVFYWQVGSVRWVMMDGKQIKLSKTFRKLVSKWIASHRREDLKNYEAGKAFSIRLTFHNGIPHYGKSLLDKRHLSEERRIADIQFMGWQAA